MKQFYGIFVFALFAGLLCAYLLAQQAAPVTIAREQAAVITARSDAEISQWYAQAALADRTAARERDAVIAPFILAMVTMIGTTIIILTIILLGAYSWQRVHRQGQIASDGIVKINGRYYRAFSEHNGAVIGLEPISAPKGVLIDTRITTDHL